jgi:hypothetical protein
MSGAWTCDSCRREYGTGAAMTTRRRCTQGCDYDLCQSCWFLTPGVYPTLVTPSTPIVPLPPPGPVRRPRAPTPTSLDCHSCYAVKSEMHCLLCQPQHMVCVMVVMHLLKIHKYVMLVLTYAHAHV